ncbi:hypothetical protein Q9966_002303 [Columba livia]|nr:hypothetical protein Q9966_002303 [Columba livia]
MATYKGCFPGTFQEPHHVTGPAPAPPPRSQPAGFDAPSRRPCHDGAAVSQPSPVPPPRLRPRSRGRRSASRWLLVMLQIKAGMAAGSRSFPVEHVTMGISSNKCYVVLCGEFLIQTGQPPGGLQVVDNGEENRSLCTGSTEGDCSLH